MQPEKARITATISVPRLGLCLAIDLVNGRVHGCACAPKGTANVWLALAGMCCELGHSEKAGGNERLGSSKAALRDCKLLVSVRPSLSTNAGRVSLELGFLQIGPGLTVIAVISVVLSGFVVPVNDIGAVGPMAATLPFSLAYEGLTQAMTGSSMSGLAVALSLAEALVFGAFAALGIARR
jgi:hypothetical protein